MKRPGRVRLLLLVLLWIWVGCVALVLDLFWNVDEFDAIRPQHRTYRAMRTVAHRMVGEPDREAHSFGRIRSRVRPRLRVARTTVPVGLYRAGPNPDAATPAGQRLLDDLSRFARTSPDPERRVAALRSATRMFQADARQALLFAQDDHDQSVRDAAASLLKEIE